KQTFFCGQCFRWKELENGSFSGIVSEKRIIVTENAREIIIESDHTREFLENYFDLAADYSGYIMRFSTDPTLKAACEHSPGIRILRQEPFETLISFIISQNNNIPRISGIIDRLCENFGEKVDGGFAFPTPKRLNGITADDLAPLRAGFRARYIADAISRVNSGEIDFEEINALPLSPARERLKQIVGVGDKVADCVLLFAFHKLDAFPKDVWVKRIMAEYYPNGLPDCVKGAEGVAQQYLFDFIRGKGC
ncbi:MAG: DNA-3-methyladenine glycosylase 2, partial [Oscillospiraceae bacterium]|nr:DNA-3-methyladenine glycosylase 2 [Oscillospiraceae bacterium]